VDALLEEHDRLHGFLSESPLKLPGDGALDRLPPGKRLGRFTIVELLGSGGMGEVYRATDANLHRDVAIKVLRPQMASDRDLVARFQREAALWRR